MSGTYLQRTGISAGNRRTYTFSAWVKRSNLGEQRIFSHEQSSGTSNISVLKWDGSNKILFADAPSGSNVINLNSSNMVFRDMNAWYHIVLRVDTTDATANNRARIYINGQDIHSELGSFSTHTQPSQDHDTFANQSGNKITIGAWVNNNNQKFDGIMSHIHFTDGYSYGPDTFGETDSTTGNWKIKTNPSVSYGTNGFFILKDGNSVTDQSGQGNNFTVGAGTLSNTEDCPSENFATLNFMIPTVSQNCTLSHGATVVNSTSGAHRNIPTTMAIETGNGKFYWEMKVESMTTHVKTGICFTEWAKLTYLNQGEEFSASNQGYSYRNDGQKENNGITSYGNSYTVGDIIGIAFDSENRKLYFAKNGTWQNSGDPTSGSTGTGAAFTVDDDFCYYPIVNLYEAKVQFNFGNGTFAGTAVSSAGTNASGHGVFEYDVPTGYTALSTKGLNE